MRNEEIGWMDTDPHEKCQKSTNDGVTTTKTTRRDSTTMVNEIDRVVEIHWIYSTSLASDPGEPKGYKQAMTDPERDK